MRRLRCLCTEAILCAVAWLQVYYDEAGNLAFKTIPSREIIPIWKDGDHLELRGVIRAYEKILDENCSPNTRGETAREVTELLGRDGFTAGHYRKGAI